MMKTEVALEKKILEARIEEIGQLNGRSIGQKKALARVRQRQKREEEIFTDVRKILPCGKTAQQAKSKCSLLQIRIEKELEIQKRMEDRIAELDRLKRKNPPKIERGDANIVELAKMEKRRGEIGRGEIGRDVIATIRDEMEKIDEYMTNRENLNSSKIDALQKKTKLRLIAHERQRRQAQAKRDCFAEEILMENEFLHQEKTQLVENAVSLAKRRLQQKLKRDKTRTTEILTKDAKTVEKNVRNQFLEQENRIAHQNSTLQSKLGIKDKLEHYWQEAKEKFDAYRATIENNPLSPLSLTAPSPIPIPSSHAVPEIQLPLEAITAPEEPENDSINRLESIQDSLEEEEKEPTEFENLFLANNTDIQSDITEKEALPITLLSSSNNALLKNELRVSNISTVADASEIMECSLGLSVSEKEKNLISPISPISSTSPVSFSVKFLPFSKEKEEKKDIPESLWEENWCVRSG